MSRITTFVLLCLFSTAALAQETLDWEKLASVDYEESVSEGQWSFTPQFPDDVLLLDGQKVKLTGFMIPLDYSQTQTTFLISAFPGDGCYFHMPGGPSTIAQVESGDGVGFTYDKVEVEGTLVVLKDDPYGLLYKVIDAKPTGN